MVLSISTNRARPKSVRCGSPFASSRMFPGLMSRWRMPRSCRIMNGPRQLCDQFRCMTDRNRFALRDGIELAALYQSHAEVTGAMALPYFVNGNNTWMLEAGGSFRLQTEPLEMRLRGPLA